MVNKEKQDMIKQAVAGEEKRIVGFLKKIVEQNSFTENKEGIGRVAEILCGAMPECFSRKIIHKNKDFAPHHLFTKKGKKGKALLMSGHMDTLWEPENSFRKMLQEKGRLTGPAVFDMKGGLAVIVWSLKILDKCGLLEDLPVTVLFNSDEEVGSVSSQEIYPSLKDKVAAALVYEGSETGGTIVIKRIGIARFMLDITGVSAHSGLFSGEKQSAILELAHRIPWLESFNRDRNRLTLNVGKIEGGVATNVIPDSARCFFEIRFWKKEYLDDALEEINEAFSRPVVPGCSLNLTSTARTMPPLDSKKTERLFDIVSKTAKTLGQKVIPQGRNGGSDASWLTSAGIPSIDGLGPVGGLGRTDKEHIFKKALLDRIELTANLLLLTELYTFL